MKEIKFHPLSSVFPLMPVSDIKELADDIKARGQQSPIIIYDGMILDGRHRYEACVIAGVKPELKEYDGDDPMGFVIAANLKRRHLTAAQKAMVAADLEKYSHGGDRKSAAAKQDANVHLDNRKTISNSLDVSPRSVATASKILDESPRLAAQVRDGKISLNAAAEKLAEKNKDANLQFDSLGCQIPKQISELWNHAEAQGKNLRALFSQAKCAIESARESRDIAFFEIKGSSQGLMIELGKMHHAVRDIVPHAVCPWCSGRLAEKCGNCGKRGFISETFWKMHVPEDLKNLRAKAK